ncbi:glycoside hydrolase family 3 protein [Atractiella rhizophila]|nr:glycoside hydrolase family 3 protein [Atractiella rhizophila]
MDKFDRSFVDASIDEVLAKLTLKEKISLLGAPNWWNTNAIPRLNIPSVRMSDGPNGVRGSSHFISVPAQCLPCATSLAATFQPDLIKDVGKFLAEEAKIKGSVILLAPTCNIQRSPLGGRAFESFSEDPFLSGTITASYVKGLQENGVASSIKHFVGNEMEDKRTAVDSVIGERALREVYLYPFMWAQKEAGPWFYMTSYNRLNGTHASEDATLLKNILRKEWGYTGPVMSDWHGTYSVAPALNAGLDLEMPGPPKWRTPQLVSQSLSAGLTTRAVLDDRVRNLLTFVQKMAQTSPETVYGDGIERSRDKPELRDFAKRVAGEGMVLLQNKGILPLKKEKVKKVLVVGPNAKGRVINGGGSANLKPTYVITPFQGIEEQAKKIGAEISYSLGCYAHKYLPTLEDKLSTADGEPGWKCTFFAHDAAGEATIEKSSYVLTDTRVKLNDFIPPGLGSEWSIKLKGEMVMEEDGPWEWGLTVSGRAKLFVDGEMIIDNWTKQTPGEFFYGQGTEEEKAVKEYKKGQKLSVYVLYTNTNPPNTNDRDDSQPALMIGVRLGGCLKIDPEQAIQAAERAAADSDAVIFVGGLTSEWESEGFDRPNLFMPGLQDEVVRRLSLANPNTVVCLQAGSALAMPWIDTVNAVLQVWYGGNEAGRAMAEILFGAINPSGKLPLTFPKRDEDVPAFLNFKSQDLRVEYTEGIYVGYKWYDARKITPLFPFGHGLSYTTFSLSSLSVTTPSSTLEASASIRVKNTGTLTGSTVVQLYILPPSFPTLPRPTKSLRAFVKVRDLTPGEEREVKLQVDRWAFAYWQEGEGGGWTALPGSYTVLVGESSADTPLRAEWVVEKGTKWTGL